MAGIKDTVKIFLEKFSENFLIAEKVDNNEDFQRIDNWVKKTKKSYKRHSIAAIIFTILCTIMIGGALREELGTNTVISFFISIIFFAIYMVVFRLAFLGFATMKMHYKKVFKSAWNAAKFGYQVGEKIQTTHIDVTHEFGNTYKVSSRTEDKGFLFAIICSFAIIISWGAYCIYKGTFLTMKKIKASEENLAKYNNA